MTSEYQPKSGDCPDPSSGGANAGANELGPGAISIGGMVSVAVAREPPKAKR